MEIKEDGLFLRIISVFDDAEKDHPENTIKIKEDPKSQLGTSTKVWDCALILGKYAIKQHVEKGKFKNINILELGAGTGLLSLMLAAIGNNVYATDMPECVQYLEKSLQNNMKIYDKKGHIVPFALDWSHSKSQIQKGFAENKVPKIDYIFASDVIFNQKGLEEFPKALRNTIEVLKENHPDQTLPIIYLSHKARNDDIDDKLAERLEDVGFFGEQIDEDEMDTKYVNKRIDIFRLVFDEKWLVGEDPKKA